MEPGAECKYPPPDDYTLPEQHAAGFGPGVLTLQAGSRSQPDEEARVGSGGGRPVGTPDRGVALLTSSPKAEVIAETDMEFYHRKQ